MIDLAVIVMAWLLAYEVWKNWRLREQLRVLEQVLELERKIGRIESRAGHNKPPAGADGEQR